jgi:hypothetical protein
LLLILGSRPAADEFACIAVTIATHPTGLTPTIVQQHRRIEKYHDAAAIGTRAGIALHGTGPPTPIVAVP